MTGDVPLYIGAHIKDRLAEDPRTHELGIGVDIRGDVVFLSGEVASEERRTQVEEVAREVAGRRRVKNEVTVTEVQYPEQEERL